MSFYTPDEVEDNKIFVKLLEPSEAPLPIQATSASSSCPSEPRLNLLDGKFFLYLPESSTSKNIVAQCVKCAPQKVEVKGYNNCSSNFLSHLKRKHGEDCVEEYKNYLKTKKKEKLSSEDGGTSSGKVFKTTAKLKKQTKTLTQEQFDENIVKFFIHSMTPLTAVENPYFSKIFFDLNISDIGLKVISLKMLENRIEDYYTKKVEDIKSKLCEIDTICIRVEILSGKKSSFIGVAAHWIANDLSRMSVALACRQFECTHSYDRISELVQEINCDFDLPVNKIVATIVDNGNSFIEAFKVFGIQLTKINMVECDEDMPTAFSTHCEHSEEEEIQNILNTDDYSTTENCSLPAYLRCCAHTLSLCATSDANNVLQEENNTQLSNIHNAVMLKCNDLWKAAGQPKSAEIIHNILQRTLSRPDDTNWNSIFNSLQEIVSTKEKSLELHRALNIKDSIKDTEYEYIQEFLVCAGPVAEALDILQGENNTYYGIVLPCLVSLRKRLKKIERKPNFNYCKPLIETYVESIERRFSQFYDLDTPESQNAAIAALSFPRFKNKWLSCVESTQRTKILNIFKTIISKEITIKPVSEETRTYKNTRKENTFFNFDSDSDSENSETLLNRSSDVPLNIAEQLMLHFFAEESQELEILNRYPEIKNIFIKYNTALPSSAPVQKLFSYATMTNLPKSHKLSDQMFQKIVVLKANLNSKEL